MREFIPYLIPFNRFRTDDLPEIQAEPADRASMAAAYRDYLREALRNRLPSLTGDLARIAEDIDRCLASTLEVPVLEAQAERIDNIINLMNG